jgi:hypothetical protein
LIRLCKTAFAQPQKANGRSSRILAFFINQLPRIFQEFSKDFYLALQRRYSALDISPNRSAEKLIQSNRKLGSKSVGRNNRTLNTETAGDK